jgi:O-antigen ligase
MPSVSSFFLVLAVILAVVIGPQTRPWTWGPSLLALGLAVAAALPVFWKKKRIPGEWGLLAFGTLVAGWFACRAWISPVSELAAADLLLLAGAVGAFICMRAIEGNKTAEVVVIWGIALLLLANIVVVWQQVLEPEFTPIFGTRAANLPSGFFAQYNEAANFLIGASLIVAAAALFGRGNKLSRVAWGLIAVAGLAAVYFTRSRGGILGAAIGSGVFVCVALTIAKQRGLRWFAQALVGAPVIGLILAGFIVIGWQDAQEIRHPGSDISRMMDNNSRLHLLGIAASSAALHPLTGGGSRSFSWESYRFFENKLHGDSLTHKPEQVHNELLQATTDYGLIGAGLLMGLLGWLAVVAVIRILFSEARRDSDHADAWRLGGLAALAGMLTQSCFSFVFHLMPGVLLLGICLGFLSRSSGNRLEMQRALGARLLISAAAVTCLSLVLTFGWKGSQVTRILWASYLGKSPVSSEERLTALSEAIRLWPQAALYQDRARVHQESVLMSDSEISQAAAESAVEDYAMAMQLHPYDPEPIVNRANLLSQLQRDAEAEAAYGQAIHLQGGMEPAFRAHFSLSNHLLRKGVRQFRAEDPSPTLEALEIAAEQMEAAVEKMHWIIADMREPRVTVHESLGAAREANGDYPGALAAYDFASTLIGGSRAHYRAAVLYGKMGTAAWSARQPGEAMGYFIEARRRLLLTTEVPQDVSASQRLEFLNHIDETIDFLKGAKIEPVPPPSS